MKIRTVAALSATALTTAAFASPVSIDGVIGSEWTGATVNYVSYNAAAPMGDFNGNPSSNTVAYNIYTRSDNDFIYVGLETVRQQGDSYNPGLILTNLYFGTVANMGSNVGFEVYNDRAFTPGVPGFYSPISTVGGHWDRQFDANNAVIEFAMSWDFFVNDPLAMGFTKTSALNNILTLRLSQSFGYSVAGGSSFGADRLGQFTYVPAPGAAAVLAGAGLLAGRRRR